jgi:protein kinase-like protein/PEGA domain-containing protein
MAEDAISAELNRAGALPPGTRIGPYRIERVIGHGGMSVVYAAIHVALDRPVALKVLLPSLGGDQEFVERFLAEAQAAARLDYPHIVPVYDSGESNGMNYIAMKLLEGRDLRAILRERRASGNAGLPLDRAISIASQAAGALEYAHRHRVVHRDVKPANIHLESNDRVTLVDFGIARALDRASTTLTGSVMGTPAYMSPEQARGEVADFRSDIYSLGAVLYEMLAGSPPFAGEPRAVMLAHQTAPPRPISPGRPDVPPGVEQVVQRALAKRPEDRFQSAGALALALTNASGGRPVPPAVAEDGADATARFADQIETTGSSLTGSALTGSLPGSPLDAALPAPRRVPLALIGVPIVVLLIALAAWAVLAGPLAAHEARLAVSSDPPGASVSVDGNPLGMTPLQEQKLPAGTHEILIEKQGYVQAKRSDRLRGGQTDRISATLTPLPASDLLTVEQAIVARDIRQTDAGIAIGAPVTSVGIDEEFGMVVTVAPKQQGAQSISFRWELALLDPSGNRLASSAPTTSTLAKDDPRRSFSFVFTFHRNSDGSISTGTYQLQFLIDNRPVVTRPVTLTQ